MKHGHLFEDGNYIEFSVNNNTQLMRSFATYDIPQIATVQIFDLATNFDNIDISDIPKSSDSKQLFALQTQKPLNLFQKCLLTIPIFHPTSKKVMLWQFLMVLIICSYFFYIPLKIAFTDDFYDMNPNRNPAVQKFLIFSIVVLAFDLLVSFNTGYIQNGQVQLNRKKIILHYLIWEFELDFIGVLSLILSLVFDQDIIRLLFYLRMYYVVRFDNKIDHKLLLKKNWKGAFLLLKLIIVMLFVAHIMACIFYGISSAELLYDEQDIGPYINTWIVYNRYATNNDKIEDSSLINRYVISFYWSITTVSTDGYGDITPKNDSEIGWALLTMIIAGMVFAFNISSIRETLQDMNQYKILHSNYQTIMNRYMKLKNITPNTQAKINDYFQYIWKEENNRDMDTEELLISKLPDDLFKQIQYETYINFIQCRFFYHMYFSNEFLFELTTQMHELNYGPGEHLELDDFKDVYLIFLQKGEVLIYVDTKQNKKEMKTRIDYVEKGNCIGQQSFVMNTKFPFKTQTQTWCNVYRVSRTSFLNIIKDHQKDFENYHQLISQRYSDPYEFYTKLDIKCFTCMSESHQADTCHVTHYIADDLVFKIRVKEEDKFYREEYHRKTKKKMNSIKNQHKIEKLQIEFVRTKKLKKGKYIDNSFDEDDQEQDNIIINQEDDIDEIKEMINIILKQFRQEIDFEDINYHKSFVPQKPQFDPFERSFCIDQVKNYEYFYPKYNLITIINRIF